MKKWILACALLLVASLSQAQMGIPERSVPGIILNDFQYRFVDAQNVSWVKLANNHYGAKFSFRDLKTEAVYEEGGNWLQSTTDIPFDYLPEDAQKYCRSYHGGSKMKSIQQISSRSYGILYDVSLIEDLHNYVITFDQYGKKTDMREIDDIVVNESEEKKKLNLGGFMKKREE